jgi:prevent-host-death family protein
MMPGVGHRVDATNLYCKGKYTMSLAEKIAENTCHCYDKLAFVSVSQFTLAVSGFIRALEKHGKNVIVTRRGKSVAVIMPYQEYVDRVICAKPRAQEAEGSDE